MAEVDYALAPVLLFDPVHANQRTTRYALNQIGFRQFDCVSSMADLKTALSETHPALLVAESSATDADVFKLVRSIRRSELGNNPFVVILLTTWSRDTTHIRRAIESGADDVIVRPFSTMFAEERVRTLIRGRKQFVVTSDYIGPDRRKPGSARPSEAQALDVPNVLRATVEKDEQALAQASLWIKEAKGTVEAERLRRVAMRIVVAVELCLTHVDDVHRLDIDDLLRSARELRAQMVRSGRAEAVEVCGALVDQINEVENPERVPAPTLKLIKELAMGAYAAYANGDSLEKSKDEIGRTVTNLRRRLKARAVEAKRRAAEAAARQEADDAGQAADEGIKRAAG